MLMLEIISSGISGDLLARAGSTARVQNIVQLSPAPAFLLGAIGAVLNVMNTRLIWIVDRVDRLEKLAESHRLDRELEELPALKRRRKYAQFAINLSTAAALVICLVIALMFISAFVRPSLGTFVATAWIMAMALVFGALLFFLMETQLATASTRERRKLSRQIDDESEQS